MREGVRGEEGGREEEGREEEDMPAEPVQQDHPQEQDTSILLHQQVTRHFLDLFPGRSVDSKVTPALRPGSGAVPSQGSDKCLMMCHMHYRPLRSNSL